MNRSSPIRTVAQLEAGDHVCFIHESEAEHRWLLTPFIRFGLEANEKVLYAADAHPPGAVIEYLRDDGMEVDPYLCRGQLVFVLATDVYLQDGVFRPDRVIGLLGAETQRALDQGFSALRVTGESSWVLKGLPGSERLVEYEARLSSFFSQARCLALCQYDKKQFDPETLQKVLFVHPIVAIGEELLDNVYFVSPEKVPGASLEQARLDHYLQNLIRYGRAQESLRTSPEETHDKQAEISAGLLKDAHGDTTGCVSVVRDIGECKRTKERLRRSARQIQAIAENVPALVSYVDESGRYRFVNGQYEKWFGIKRTDIIGKHYRDVLGVETYRRIKKRVDAALGGRHVHYQDTLPYMRGGHRWVVGDYLPDTDEGGEVRGFFALVADITLQKQSEQRLRERLNELTCLYEVHRSIQENLSVEALCERVAQSLSVAMQFPDDTVAVVELGGKRSGGEQRRSRKARSLHAEIGAQGEACGQIEISHPRGKSFQLPEEQDLLNSVADALGAWFADRQAREELARSQSNLTRAQRIGHLGSWEWDVSAGILTWSDELYRIFGVSKGDLQLTHEGIEAMIHPDDRATNTQRMLEMLRHGSSSRYGFRIVRPDGEIRHILQIVEVACGTDGKAERIFGIMQDITEQKHLEQESSRRAAELQQLSKRLAHAQEQERARIAKELHDELGQALTAVRINVSQLERGLRRRSSPELMARLRETGELADQLLRQTRDLALSLRPSMLDDLGLTAALRWYTRRFAERAGMEIDLEVEGREGRSSESLRTVIYRTVQEALTNVARHAQASRVGITLKFGTVDLALQVKDDGRGFDVAQPCGIDSERSHIGLLGMRESVEALAGELVVQSSPNRGTTIAVRVPLGESP